MVIYGDGEGVIWMGCIEAPMGGFLQGRSTSDNSFNSVHFMRFSMLTIYYKGIIKLKRKTTLIPS